MNQWIQAIENQRMRFKIVFFKAKFSMFKAAFSSLSCILPHLGQIHVLSFNFNELFINPQLEQVLDDASNLPI